MKSDSLIGTSRWQLVFSQSKVNGGYYDGEKLPTLPWHWPKDTFLQRRRQFLKSSRVNEINAGRESDNAVFESVCTEYVRSGTANDYYKNRNSN
jgi:hypothetical protein